MQSYSALYDLRNAIRFIDRYQSMINGSAISARLA